MAKLTAGIAIAMSLYHILYVSTVFERLGIYFLGVTHRAISLTFILALIFLLIPARKREARNRLPWYDAVLVVLAMVGTGYVALFFEKYLVVRPGMAAVPEVVLGVITIILILEATRRVVGLAMPLVCVFFLIHPLLGSYFPGFLHARNYSFARLIGHMYLWSEGIWGMPMGVAATVLISFIIFSQFLQTSGAGEFFIKVAFALFGRVRGGPAKAAVVGSALFGTISGSTVANVTGTGVFTIPMMKKVGYKPEFAAAVEAVSSNGGQIMPPVMGAVAFIIPEFLGIPYAKVVAVSVLPAVLYFLAVFVMVDLEAAKTGLKSIPSTELPSFGQTFKEGWFYLLPLLVLIGLLMGLLYAPERSALLGLVSLVLVSFLSKKARMGPRKILSGLEGAARQMLMIGAMCAAAGIIIGSVSLTGLGARISTLALELAQGNLLILLLLCAFASFILGMGLSSVAVYIMLAVLVAPAMVQAGVPPIAAHLFVFWWGLTALITPPVAMAAYVGAGIARADPFRTGWQACRLGITTFLIPFAFVYRPALLGIGSWDQIVLAVITGIFGAAALAAGVAGYVLDRASWWERSLLVVGGILLIAPGWQVMVAGAALVSVALLKQVANLRKKANAPDRLRAAG